MRGTSCAALSRVRARGGRNALGPGDATSSDAPSIDATTPRSAASPRATSTRLASRTRQRPARRNQRPPNALHRIRPAWPDDVSRDVRKSLRFYRGEIRNSLLPHALRTPPASCSHGPVETGPAPASFYQIVTPSASMDWAGARRRRRKLCSAVRWGKIGGSQWERTAGVTARPKKRRPRLL